MSKSKVTKKYQITIPKKIRERLKLRPGEVLSLEPLSENEIRLKRFSRIEDPLNVLIGKRPPVKKSIPIVELEEAVESRA